ncbi:helix-turn-helix domain-containing protein [Janibacter limosus]|uniref:LysR family transcriptional regulator n=1 Tax=Janibacter limosus TaxID=53458 RepID=A0AC61U4Q6_9MICO|nr:LysR family transcriptional regulator [Janibacter limosus]
MQFTLRRLTVFATLARTGHFGRAADELGLAQPTVSGGGPRARAHPRRAALRPVACRHDAHTCRPGAAARRAGGPRGRAPARGGRRPGPGDP